MATEKKNKVTSLLKIQNYIGGAYRISKRGVPHLVFNELSVCYFGKNRFLRVFSGYGTNKSVKYLDFKTYPELVRHFHYKLGYKWVSNWHLDKK